jgi:hypothetical protein
MPSIESGRGAVEPTPQSAVVSKYRTPAKQPKDEKISEEDERTKIEL